MREIHRWAINWGLRVSAVSYLNTWPLVWGFLHGPGRGMFDFRFDLPAECAQALGNGDASIRAGSTRAELDRLGLDYLPDLGIACDGPVRSILLISRRPFREIRTLAVDSGSRSSVALARIQLAERYGCQPQFVPMAPDLATMLAAADAALIIGDPALQIDPTQLPYRTLDLGAEWVAWSGLPMVFAVWAGKAANLTQDVARAFADSCKWGLNHMDEIVAAAARERGVRSGSGPEISHRTHCLSAHSTAQGRPGAVQEKLARTVPAEAVAPV